MWVKICGTTNLDDALAAVDAGADALGFVFAESPRRMEPAAAGEITRAVPERVERIGVFVDESTERIRKIVEEAGLTGVQLHGDKGLEFAMSSTGEPGSSRRLQLILAFPTPRSGEISQLLLRLGNADRVLLDTAVQGKRGGSGETWNWEMGRASLEIMSGHMKIIIAGGLTPGNVADAIRTLRPWGVDVSSGVELEPGKKDHEKVRAFVKAAKSLRL